MPLDSHYEAVVVLVDSPLNSNNSYNFEYYFEAYGTCDVINSSDVVYEVGCFLFVKNLTRML